MAKSIKDLHFDEHNFNQHTPEGMELLRKSIKQNGFGRSIVVDKNENIIGGNGVAESALKLGKTKIKVIETNGDELVVVKRNDIDINTKKGRDLAYADNKTAEQNLKWNQTEVLQAESIWGMKAQDWLPKPTNTSIPKEEIQVDGMENLPAELQGIDLMPNKLEKIQGDGRTLMERVIICFKPEHKDELAQLLGMATFEKVLYVYETEIVGSNG